MRHILGIDPGLSDGIAVIDERFQLVDCFRMPVKDIGGKNKVDVGALFARLSQFRIDLAVLELVGTRPGEGAVGAFSFGDRDWPGLERWGKQQPNCEHGHRYSISDRKGF